MNRKHLKCVCEMFTKEYFRKVGENLQICFLLSLAHVWRCGCIIWHILSFKTMKFFFPQ